MSKMDHETTATVIDEIHLAQGAKTCSQILSASSAELGPGLSHFCAIKLNSTVVLSDLGRFTAQCSFNTPGSSKERTAVSGVAFSPCGNYVAAFSSDELYVARVYSVHRVGQLRHVAQLAGIKTVHWCPGSTALAVCCKQQVDIYLLVLPAWPPAGNPPAHHPALALAPLQRLPGPRTASTGARCVSWLPRSPGSPAALLAAWPSDLLMYTWGPSGQGADWSSHKVHRFLAGWPGSVRAITTAPCPSSSDSYILGTVDAQLDLGHSESTSSPPCSKLGAAISPKHSPAAAAAAAADGSCSARPAAALDHTGRQKGASGLITELQPDDAAGVDPCAVTHTGQPLRAALGAATAEGSAFPDINIAIPGLLPNGGDLAMPHDSSGGVLSSLMNIHSNSPAGSGSSSSTNNGSGSSTLCLLQVSIADFFDSSSHGGGAKHGAGAVPGQQQGHSHTSPKPKQGSAGGTPPSRSAPFSSMLKLPHLPLPDLLAVHGSIVAIGSTKGPPLVSLCSFAAREQGLLLLQTVAIPLPGPVQDAGGQVKARLEALLLTPAVQQNGQQQQQEAYGEPAAGSAGTRYPAVDGGWPGVVDGDEMWCSSDSSSNSNSQPQLPDLVVLVNCTEMQNQGSFANIGRTAGDKAADMFLLKCKAPEQPSQARPQQATLQPQPKDVGRVGDPAPLHMQTGPTTNAAAAAAAGAAAAAPETAATPQNGSMWWQGAAEQAAKEKQPHRALAQQQQQQQPHGVEQQRQQSTSKQLQQQQQQQHVPSKAEQRLLDLKHKERRQLEGEQHQLQQRHMDQRQRELKHPSGVSAVGRSVSADTVNSCVSNGTTWSALSEDWQQQSQLNSQQAKSQRESQQQRQQQQQQPPQQKQERQEHQHRQQHQQQHEADELQPACGRVSKVVAVLSGKQSRLQNKLELQPEVVSGSISGGSGLRSPELSLKQLPDCSRPCSVVCRLEKQEEQQLNAVPDQVPGCSGLGPDTSDMRQCDAAFAYTQQHLLLQCVQETAAAASSSAVDRLQATVERRLDALLESQQQQQVLLQQQLEEQQQHNKLLLAQMRGEVAMADALASLQSRLESKLDTLHSTMRDMARQMDRLATGIEDLEAN